MGRRQDDPAHIALFSHALGRWLTPVAERCGLTTSTPGTAATWCGDPRRVAAATPWLVDDEVLADALEYQGCLDLHVEWRDGWVTLHGHPFVEGEVHVAAGHPGEAAEAVREIAHRLTEALDAQEPLRGADLDDDPRPPDGSKGVLRRWSSDG